MLEILECLSDVVNYIDDILFLVWSISVDGKDKSFQENGHIRKIYLCAIV